MKSLEFMYWLQGCFEVCDVEQISVEQLQKIQNHLKMVDVFEGKQQLPFCHWLNGFLSSLEQPMLNLKQTAVLKEKLNSIFEHVIESKMSNTSQTSNLDDGFSVKPSSDTLFRC